MPFVAPIFTDHMVLQRGMADPIWGWSKPGTLVLVVTTGGDHNRPMMESATATAGNDGKWTAKLPKLPVGGPYQIYVKGSKVESVTFSDVLSGDVWVCSGQSNMQFGIGNAQNADAEIADAANYPQIRFFYVKQASSQTPQDLIQGGPWDICSPESAKADGSWNGITAVGYFFCRDLYKATHIPIGLVSTSVGGTPAEAWTSIPALQAKTPDLIADLPQREANVQAHPDSAQNLPGWLFDAMINPLIPYGVKGFAWYQGEANSGRGYAYRTLLPTLIDDWRARWMEGSTPFLIVQLAGWQDVPADIAANPGDDGFAEVRDAQAYTAQHVPNAYLATAIDIGDQQTIHPTNKQETGRRLALIAEKEVYGIKDAADSGPTFKSMRIQGNTVKITFNNAKGGLVVGDGKPVAGFALAGSDHKWSRANATLSGNTVTLTSAGVPNPVAVRYAWAGWLPLNLYGKDGLPVYPFRTDDWKLLSQP